MIKESDRSSEVHNPFRIGQKVIDRTARANGWDDVQGTVIEVDGSNIKVRYISGNERWKMTISLDIVRE
ncbi:MAG: hypothetical protein QG639_635 [Patescibacteria group bacterium]|nr:hypothetical protein [Patescibacteria group bacterium]